MARQMLRFNAPNLGQASKSGQPPRWEADEVAGLPGASIWTTSMNDRSQSRRTIGAMVQTPNSSVVGSSVHASAVVAATFETLQRRLTQDRLRSIESLRHAAHVKWASEEASSLAWMTGFPLLLFPSLFEEKSEAALHQARRQDEIHARSRELLDLTVLPTQ